MQGRHLSATLLGVVLTWLGAVQARADYLSDLIGNNSSVQVGNLLFDDFHYSPTGQMPISSNVTVNPIFDASGNPGLRFGGGFTDVSDGSTLNQQASDALLSYRVTALSGILNSVHLFGNPQIVGPGDGVMSIVETFQSGPQAYQLEIHDAVNGGVHTQKLLDSVSFAPTPALPVVTKDIFALNLGGFPTASFIDQTFSTTAVPEPGSLLLLGLGASVLFGYRWRRRRLATTA
jgi:hypothetical protein